jgi:hypothetical protein
MIQYAHNNTIRRIDSDCVHILAVNSTQQKSQRLTFGIMELEQPKTERGTNGSRTAYIGRGCSERVDAEKHPPP